MFKFITRDSQEYVRIGLYIVLYTTNFVDRIVKSLKVSWVIVCVCRVTVKSGQVPQLRLAYRPHNPMARDEMAVLLRDVQ